MKSNFFLFVLCLFTISNVRASDAPSEAAQKLAPQKVGAFKKTLITTLQSKLKDSPLQALDVCQAQAPSIAAQFSQEGFLIGRTSHRVRNPKNSPKDWMNPLLKQWQSTSAAKPASAQWTHLGGKHWGYAEPLYTQEFCLGCHGEKIAPEITSFLKTHYPKDQATGFKAGQFRGLVWLELTDTTN